MRLGRHWIEKWLRLGLRPSKMSIESPPRDALWRAKDGGEVKALARAGSAVKTDVFILGRDSKEKLFLY